MMHEHNSAHGSHRGNSKYTEEHLEKVKTHPWVEHAIDMMHNTGMHPGDLNKRNMGIYTHPVTGKKHLAIIDYGYSREIANKYTKARRNSAAKQY
jgi:tRNA A-37 threonylcarbamoyl transferase component Bud32